MRAYFPRVNERDIPLTNIYHNIHHTHKGQDMSLEEFLRKRQIPEETIKYFVDQKIDCEAICAFSDEDLKDLIPAHGDRVAITNFCKRYSSTTKQSLIERLRQKMTGKEKKSSTSRQKPYNASKPTRMIEIGWMSMCQNENRYRQVRSKSGGGTRRVNVSKMSRCIEVLEIAKNLFFPNGISPKGPTSDFEFELMDFKSNSFDTNMTIQEMYELAGLATLRFYLATIERKKNTENMDDFIPASHSSASTSSRPNNRSSTSTTSLDWVIIQSEPTNIDGYVEKDQASSFINSFSQELNEDIPNSELNFELSELFEVADTSLNEKTLIIHRGNIFDDLLHAFEQDFFDKGHFKLELILPTGEKELAEDYGGVWRDVLSEFWCTFYEKCTFGTTLKVPYIRHDFGELQWKAIAKIFFKGFTMERYIPVKIAPVFLKTCFNLPISDEDLINDFYNYICDTDRKMFEQAQENFQEVDSDELLEIFSTYESKWKPNEDNFKQLLRDIAHKELIQKPAFVVKCFQKVWEGKITNIEEIFNLYEEITPTVRNCLRNIQLQEPDNVSNEQNMIFSFLKKYLKESDDNIRGAFFRFCTGSNLPIMTIKLAFTDTVGINRTPIAHTCSGLLQLSTTYENFVTLRSELNSVLNSNIWIMDII